MRRPGVGAGRREGFRGIGSGGGGALAPYTPSVDSTFYWDATDPAVGAVASWLDRISGVSAAQATGTKQPLKVALGIGGAYPSITFDGGDVLVAPTGPIVSWWSQASIIIGMQAPLEVGSTAKMVLEHTTNATSTAGGAAFYINDVSSGRVCGACKGGASGSSQRFASDAHSVYSVFNLVCDMTATGSLQVVAIRKNGSPLALTDVVSTATVGTFANASTYIGGRGTTPALGVIADLRAVVMQSTLTTGGVSNAERYVAALGGLVI